MVILVYVCILQVANFVTRFPRRVGEWWPFIPEWGQEWGQTPSPAISVSLIDSRRRYGNTRRRGTGERFWNLKSTGKTQEAAAFISFPRKFLVWVAVAGI